MNPDDYFISGYTGFCPDMTDRIGRNFHKATRDVMKIHPHLRTRLNPLIHPSDMQKDSDCDQGDCNYYYSMAPHYTPAYDPSLEPNMCYSCQGDGRSYNTGAMYPQQGDGRSCNTGAMYPQQGDGRSCNTGAMYPQQGDYQPYGMSTHYPQPSYPLSCSQWGSPCVSKHCNEMYKPCVVRQSYNYQDYMMMPQGVTYSQNAPARYQRASELCCGSCAQGGPCSGDAKSTDSGYKYPRGEKYSASQLLIDQHRKGGVVPNYMGHIPGMQHSFGESYGIAAGRLLRRHFDDLSRKML